MMATSSSGIRLGSGVVGSFKVAIMWRRVGYVVAYASLGAGVLCGVYGAVTGYPPEGQPPPIPLLIAPPFLWVTTVILVCLRRSRPGDEVER